MFDMGFGNKDEWEMNDEELQADLDADVFEDDQVIDPDNVEPPEKENE